ncbi:beta-1,3-galactosyltransferase 1-like [Tubulanus polymorphus]|uniref:beta-1,3-galactosyltransferase 1-like n=1 Tax=Tubulanus polymorphus TaxID=672921 RepID=UPI003DA67731
MGWSIYVLFGLLGLAAFQLYSAGHKFWCQSVHYTYGVGKAAVSVFGIPKRVFKAVLVLGFINMVGYMVYLSYPNSLPVNVVYMPDEYIEQWITVNSSNQTVRIRRRNLHPEPITLPSVVVNPHEYNYVINREDICANATIDLMVVVTTAVSSFNQRKAIRTTWGSAVNEPRLRTRLIFIVGSANDSAAQYTLQEESDVYQDIVQKDFIDTYRNLTIKSIAMVKWVRDFCPQARFLLKSDDDMFINIPLLIKHLNETNKKHRRFYFCACQYQSLAMRKKSDKWFVTKREYSAKYYPPYCAGSQYSMSGSIVAELYEHSRYIPFFWLEDVFLTGMLGKRLKIHHEHNKLVQFWRTRPDACLFNRIISSHHLTPKEMYRVWDDLHDNELVCK